MLQYFKYLTNGIQFEERNDHLRGEKTGHIKRKDRKKFRTKSNLRLYTKVISRKSRKKFEAVYVINS